MAGFRLGIARGRRLPGRVTGLAAAAGLLLSPPAREATRLAVPTPQPARRRRTSTASATPAASPARGSAADCISMATCYTPQQLEVAYGVQPLLQRGTDGRGETVVLPELAESQLSPPLVTDLRGFCCL